jgi:hypothetical protein
VSARDVIAGVGMAYSRHSVGTFTADAILSALHSMPAPDRLALARALVPEGWVVTRAMVERLLPDDAPEKYGPEWEQVEQAFNEIEQEITCNGFADGWNACRAAMLAAAQEEADAT